jgi:hypothetical protein
LVCVQKYLSYVKELLLGYKGNVTLVLRECYGQSNK